jgi:hypothetical protein
VGGSHGDESWLFEVYGSDHIDNDIDYDDDIDDDENSLNHPHEGLISSSSFLSGSSAQGDPVVVLI